MKEVRVDRGVATVHVSVTMWATPIIPMVLHMLPGYDHIMKRQLVGKARVIGAKQGVGVM